MRDSNTQQKILVNDPRHGLAHSSVKQLAQQANLNKQKQQNNQAGYEKNGDTLLSERFNPNNTELNKIRFKEKHGNIFSKRDSR